jgi:hypothetical protein
MKPAGASARPPHPNHATPCPYFSPRRARYEKFFRLLHAMMIQVSYPVDRLMTKKKKEQVFDGTFTAEDQGVFDV